MKINAHEIKSISTSADYLKIPLMDADTSTATVESIDLDGYEFQGLVVGSPLANEIDVIVNLETGMVFEMLPVGPYSADKDTEQRARRSADIHHLTASLSLDSDAENY